MSRAVPGEVVWFEIATTDRGATEAYYGTVLGWSFFKVSAAPGSGRRYTRIQVPGLSEPIGGLSAEREERDEISLSVYSPDVLADAAKLVQLGASVLVAPTLVAETTWYARLRDPLGSSICLLSPADPDPDDEMPNEDVGRPSDDVQPVGPPPAGSFAWFEIGTTDVQATQAFYGRAFGWRFEWDDRPGAPPAFTIFTGHPWPSGTLVDHGPSGTGAGHDYAIPFFLSDDVAATVATAERVGGAVASPPRTSPSGLVAARITDPQGNLVGVYSLPVVDPGPG